MKSDPRLLILGTMSLSLVLAGCGQSAGEQTANQNNCYIHSSVELAPYNRAVRDVEFFSAFVNDHDTFYTARLSSGGTRVVTSQSPVTLQKGSGNNVTLNFSNLAFGPNQQQTLNGTLSGSTLTIDIPQNNGNITPVTFAAGSIAEYNGMVHNLRHTAAIIEGYLKSQQAQQQQQAQVAQEKQQMKATVESVKGDMQTLIGAVSSMQSDLGQMKSDVGQEQQDVYSTYQDLQTTIALAKQHPNGDNGAVGQDAASVGQDAAAVGQDQAAVNSDQDTVNSDLSTVSQAIGQLQSDFQTLQQLISTLPTYQPPYSLPTQSQVNQAITAAQSAMATVKQAEQHYWFQSQSLNNQAQTYANQALNY